MPLLRRYALRGALIGAALGIPVSIGAQAAQAAVPMSVQAGAGTDSVYVYVDSFYPAGRLVAWNVSISRNGNSVSRARGQRRTNDMTLDHTYWGRSTRAVARYLIRVRVTWTDAAGAVSTGTTARYVMARVR